MDQTQLAYYRRLLVKQKEEAQKSLASFEDKDAGGLKDYINELSMYDNHPADIGTETFEQSKDLGLKDLVQRQIRKIDDALGRIADGNYGICEGCGKGIPIERLDAMPSTTLCYECRQGVDDQVTSHRRPVEEGVVMPPFGGFAEDRLGTKHEVQYDGEDAWQEVERFGTSSSGLESNIEEEGTVEDVEGIPVYKDEQGLFYHDLRGKDDEDHPGQP